MSNDTVMTVTVKGIGDFSDVVSNVGAVQKALTKLKLPDKLGDNLNKNITNFYKEYEKYQQKITAGVKTQGDYNQVEKSLNRMRTLYQEIGQDALKLTKLDMKDMLNLDTGEFKKISDELTNIIKQIGSTKIDTSVFNKAFGEIRNITKSNKVTGDNGILNQMIGHINTGQINEAKKQLQELQAYAKKVAPRTTAEGKQAPGTLSVEKYNQLTAAIAAMGAAFNKADAEMAPLIEEQNRLQKELEETKQKASQSIGDEFSKYNQASKDVEKVTDSLKRMHQEEFSFNREAQNIDRQIQSYFGLSQMIRKVGDIAKDAFQTVKELDKAMTETAVVTNFSVGDMWEMLPTYTKQANQLGSTIKDVYEAATLYYQQGLNTNQAMSLANETLKMARIAGLDAAEATNMMTAALRGFNMEINQQSAQKINDIYSELAAITASDTKEIGSAMERTASIANSANMEFATTSAFLAQMIETTREAPENLGTAMKTIVARFQEMKQDPTKLVDSEGVAMDANKVDKALKTIGVQLMNTKGEFRDLDDVFLDIASRWDSLTQGQQRYIATIAAGSRQQSRFIAMMSNYERTMELVDAANNSAGASQRQFEKTLDSMEAKLNKLKNAWDQFTMGLMNNQVLKFGVDALTKGFTIVNKFIDILGKIPPKPFEGITKSVLTLVTTLGMLQLGKRGSRGLVQGTFGWWKEGKSFTKSFAEGWAGPEGTKAVAKDSKYGDAIRASIISAKIPQTIQGEFQKGKTLATATFNSGTKIIAVNNLINSAEIEADAKAKALEWWAIYQAQIESGQIDFDSGVRSFNSQMALRGVPFNLNSEDIDNETAKITELGNEFTGVGAKITNAGASLQAFGQTMQGTPFEPFGNALVRIGNLLISCGDTAVIVGKKITKAFEAAKKVEGGFGAKTGAFFSNLVKNPKLLLVITILAAVATAIYMVATASKRALETITDAAAAASEAYDSAKQETSELTDAIEQIKTNEDAFDGLVVGTAAFNEQLVTANDQIMELIKKYPMLNEYLTTDKNGVMHISDEGLNAVKEYQKQLQARASALNILQNADLNAEENRQKAADLRKIRGSMTQKEHDQNLQEAELLEQRIEAENESAKLAAVNTALVDKELGNQEKVAAILADQYNTRKSMVKLEGDKHDLRQQYADFYGYNYNRSTKKMTDIEGNEIEINDKVIKDALRDITVLADLEVDAGSVDTAISSIDKKFSQHFKDNSFFSDILSNNIETNEDLLKDLLQNPDKLQDAVSELSTKELAAIMGVSADAVEMAPDKYSKQLINNLTEKAKNIAESQANAWGEFGVMLAQAEGASADGFARAGKIGIEHIQKQFENYTAKQRDLMLSIGKSLESGAGTESMETFIRGASEIYRGKVEETITEFNGLIENVNWDSPIARLKAYKNLTASTTPQIKQMGEELLNSKESANLLGEAFEEFYNSSDWAEVAENMDNFADSTGKLNAVGVEEMAQQCHSLNNLLDTGAISAGGVAAAINALGSDGELTLLDLNSAVLQLLSNFGQLDDIISHAHNSIENFDWGLDTGESADFVKESAEKWNELYEGGEIGNPQLEAYAKYILGEENYIAQLKANHGDLQATMDYVSKFVNEYADGFDKAWDSLANGEWTNKVPEELKDLNISFGYDDDGNWEWNPGTATTEQLLEWLQAVKGIGPEMAAAMIEDWQNYSPDFRVERQKNDFYAGLDNYISGRTGENGVAVTKQELETIAAATGQEYEEVKTAIEEAAEQTGQKLTEIDNTVEGKTYADLNAEYSQAKTGRTDKSWIDQLVTTVNGQKQVDASEAITQAISDGFTQTQAENMAYDELSKAVAEGTDVWYKDKLLTPEDLASFDNFKTAIEDFESSSQWVEIGKAIAEGYVSYMSGNTTPDTDDTSSDKSGQTTSSLPNGVLRAEERDSRGNMSQTPGYSQAEVDNFYAQQNAEVKEWWHNFWAGSEQPTTGTTELTPAQEQKMYGYTTSDTEDSNTALVESSASIELAATGLTEASTNLTSATKELSSSAKELSSAADKLNTSDKQPGGTFTGGKVQINQSEENTQNSINIDTSEAEAKIIALQTKLAELNNLINQGGTYKLKVTGVKDIQNAAAAAQKITKNSGTKTIGVKTGKADTSSVTTAKNTIDQTKGTIQVGANTSSALSEAERARSIIDSKSATIDVDVHVRKTGINSITIDGKTVTVNTGASGKNNHGYANPPSFGSLAKGNYGQLGPRGKGGLTLTGELGYEIAWLPDENRSMILGANGPQMVNLPGNAVIWNHEQSKKIIKQKAIPAGSHSKSTRPGKGNNTNNITNDTTSKKVSNAADKVENAADALDGAADAVQRVSVWWENMGRRVDNTQRKVDNSLNKIEKKFETFGTTAQSMKKLLTGYKKNLKTSISLNKKEVKKAKAELKSLDTGKAAASQAGRQAQWEAGAAFIEKISFKSGDDTKTLFADLSGYIKKLKDGTYVVDQKALDKIANKDQRKATADAANKAINDRISKLTKAEDNINKAKEALTKLADDVYKTFYQWEKSITKVYILSQKLEQLNNRLTTSSSRAELQYSKLLAGITDSASALPEILSALTDQRNLMINKVNATEENVGATRAEYLNSISLSTYQNRYNKAKKANGGTVSKEAANDLKAAQEALKLFNNANNDYAAAVKALNKKNISSNEYDAIKKVLDDIYSKQTALIDAENNAYSTVKEIYDKIEEYQSFISEFETDLLSGLEKEAENQIKHLDKLNSSLTKAYKDLLDEVKRKLDERRKQEDNAKTEQDISQKQQRLAALRADTSGGHQVEIAQLEKEIAEAQQNYQRTLEDQLLDKLQQQGDEAEKQRQRQIELLEAQNEIASDLGTNLEQVKIWLSDPEQYFEDIKNVWLENKGYSDATPGEQKQLLEQFESAWTQYRAYTQDLPQFMEIAGSRLADISDSNDRQVSSLKATEDYLSTISNDLKVLRTYGVSVAEAVQRGYTQKDIHDAGYTALQFKEGIPEATIKDAMAAGYSKMEAATAYGALEALTTGNISGSITQKATGASAKEMQQIINSDSSGNAVQKDLAGVKLDKFDSNGSKKGGTNISGAQLSDIGKSVGAHKGSTFYWQDWDEKTGKVTGKVKSWTIDKLPAKYVGAQPDARQALKYAITHQEIGSIINKNMKELVNSSDAAKKYFIGQNFNLKGGYTGSMGSQGNILYNKDGTVWVWNPSTGANKVYKKYKKSTYLEEAKKNGNTSAAYARALIQRKAYTKAELEKKGITKFKTGGLATTTGPAWLDGTPSKPELVLNATDTRNFLALKDVLASAMKGMGDTSNTYGDIMYEININVDKIEKDYDVDRVVDKVKKEITKGAGYRNVTQVRNLR